MHWSVPTFLIFRYCQFPTRYNTVVYTFNGIFKGLLKCNTYITQISPYNCCHCFTITEYLIIIFFFHSSASAT